MFLLVSIWVAVGLTLTAFGSRSRSAGLPLAYFLGLSVIHVPGAVLYIDSESSSLSAVWTRLGFEQTVIGMIAFAVAVFIARMPSSFRRRAPARRGQKLNLRTIAALDRLA